MSPSNFTEQLERLMRTARPFTDRPVKSVTLREALTISRDADQAREENNRKLCQMDPRRVTPSINKGLPVKFRDKPDWGPAINQSVGNWRALYYYMQWLESTNRLKRVDVDHSICRPVPQWPLLKQLASDFRRYALKNEWTDREILGNIFQQNMGDRPEDWTLEQCFVPMWAAQESGDGLVAMNLLEGLARGYFDEEFCSDGLPEIVFEIYGNQSREILEKIGLAAQEKEYRRFPKIWQAPLRFIIEQELYCITSFDLENQGMEIDSAADWPMYFSAFRAHWRMQIVTLNLYMAFEDEPEERWQELFERFGARRPGMKEPVKIAIKV